MDYHSNVALDRSNQWRKGQSEFTTPVISSAALIIFAVLFFPISYILWVVRLVKHRDRSYMRVRDVRLGGHILLISGLILIFAYMGTTMDPESNTSYGVMGIIAIIASVGMRLLSKKMQHKLDASYQIIDEQVSRQGMRQVAQLAQATGRPVHQVKEDVKYLTSLGLFSGFVLDTSTWTLTEFSRQRSTGPSVQSSPAAASTAAANGGNRYTTSYTTTTYSGPLEFSQEELEEIGERTKELVDSIFNSGNQAGAKHGSSSSGSQAKAKAASEPPKPAVKYCPGCGAAIKIAPGETKSCDFCGNVVSYQ